MTLHVHNCACNLPKYYMSVLCHEEYGRNLNCLKMPLTVHFGIVLSPNPEITPTSRATIANKGVSKGILFNFYSSKRGVAVYFYLGTLCNSKDYLVKKTCQVRERWWRCCIAFTLPPPLPKFVFDMQW